MYLSYLCTLRLPAGRLAALSVCEGRRGGDSTTELILIIVALVIISCSRGLEVACSGSHLLHPYRELAFADKEDRGRRRPASKESVGFPGSAFDAG